MKKQMICLLLIGGMLFSPAPVYAEQDQRTEETPSSGQSVDLDSEYQEGTVLVAIASPAKTSLAKKGTMKQDQNITVEESFDFGDASDSAKTAEQKQFLEDKTLYISEVSSDSYSTGELIEKLDDQAYVLSVEPDYVQHLSEATDDTYSAEQWYLDGDSSYGGGSTGISYSSAKEKTKTGTPVVAVMDTGIDYEHEDLAEHMWVNPYVSQGLAGIYGYDFIKDNSYCMDVEGHGTHCAGIIAAQAENQKGIAGISEAKLMALKVFNEEGETTNSTIIKGLNYIIQAKQAGVNITAVNCSWGGGSSGSVMPQLIQKIGSGGTLFVFASGNDGVDHDSAELSCPYDLYQDNSFSENRNYIVITGASDPDDNAADFSDYGSQDVDLFAPGSRIVSTYPEDTYFAGIYDSEKENELTGHLLTFGSEIDAAGIYTDTDLGIRTSASNIQTTYLADTDYREASDSGSLFWSFRLGGTSSASRTTYLYLDVTDDDPDINADYYVSLLMGVEETAGCITWQHVVKHSEGTYGSTGNRFYQTSDGRIYFKLIGISAGQNMSGTLSYYLDDIGLSVADPDSSQFGQYELLNGTSMAAPMVSGALGLLSGVYPEDSLTDRRNRLLTCVRQTGTLSGKCISGGILDLSKMDSYTPQVTTSAETRSDSSAAQNTSAGVTSATKTKTVKKVKKVKIKKSKVTLRAGNKLKLTATVTPKNATNKRLRWSSSKKKWASVSQKGVVTAKKKGRGHTVKITAAARDGSGKKAVCKIKIKK